MVNNWNFQMKVIMGKFKMDVIQKKGIVIIIIYPTSCRHAGWGVKITSLKNKSNHIDKKGGIHLSEDKLLNIMYPNNVQDAENGYKFNVTDIKMSYSPLMSEADGGFQAKESVSLIH